jgi:hypothetical protein
MVWAAITKKRKQCEARTAFFDTRFAETQIAGFLSVGGRFTGPFFGLQLLDVVCSLPRFGELAPINKNIAQSVIT